MTKFNLGCGNDVRAGYVNVDFRSDIPGVVNTDLSVTPWPFLSGCADEVMMLDFLEHFPYRKTNQILMECWRILKPGGELIVQVPDFDHLAHAITVGYGFKCNRCGWSWDQAIYYECQKCGQKEEEVQEAAVQRLFGGQDFEGNWHHTTFTKSRLSRMLVQAGFQKPEFLERNENGETFYQNWNFRLRTRKLDNLW